MYVSTVASRPLHSVLKLLEFTAAMLERIVLLIELCDRHVVV